MFGVKRAVVLPMMVAAIAACQPAIAQVLSDSQEPGSLLVFPFIQTGTIGGVVATTITVSVTCPTGAICPLHQPVNLRLHWVCPASAGVCQERDFALATTVNGTVRFHPGDGGSIPAPPCFQGYLLVWVVDTFRNAIKFDGLSGKAVIHQLPTADTAYNAIPIQAGANLANGAIISRDGAPLPFNGTGYKEVTGQITGGIQFPGQTAPGANGSLNTFLIFLTLDVMSNRPNPPTFVDFNFYNEAEAPISASTSFTCWGFFFIDGTVPANFTTTGNGLVQSSQAQLATGAPVTLLGLVLTQEFSDGVFAHTIVPLLNNSVPVPTVFFPEGAIGPPPPVGGPQ